MFIEIKNILTNFSSNVVKEETREVRMRNATSTLTNSPINFSLTSQILSGAR